MENNNICKAHSGCITDINNLKEGIHELWAYTKETQNAMRKEISDTQKVLQETSNTIQSRINVVLGGIAVACILMVINLLVGR